LFAVPKEDHTMQLGVTTAVALALLRAVAAAPVPAPGATITASPPVLQHSGDVATLSWSGVVNPTMWDIVAIFASNASQAPMGYLNVSGSSTWASGSGSVSVPLVNMRSAYVFAYMLAGVQAIATSSPLPFADVNEVTQVHLSSTDSVTSTAVMWTSADDDSNGALHVVMWGPNASELMSSAAATTSTYSVSDLCAAPANTTAWWWNPGSLHTAGMPR
jgi:hypothetical protein